MKPEAIIHINHLNYHYPNGYQALRDISLTINAGEKIALIGQNGAGKSTLLLHLNGIYAGQGEININGYALVKSNLKKIRAKVGLVFQSPDDQLFSPTVFDDIAYGPIYMGLSPMEIEKRVDQALKDVEMLGFSERVTYHLSMGEKKRIAIATVLAMQPEILVFDEPTAGLDPRARRKLISLIETLPQTLIVATHDLAFAQKSFTRVVLMNHGQIMADGDPSELIENNQLLAENGL
ncbi:MAG: ABC transporter ATP-binding protein [Anaerolineaceae bacterium]|nr:ABC transporter ATP-binding protein [Anaerolineaceae bacterium]